MECHTGPSHVHIGLSYSSGAVTRRLYCTVQYVQTPRDSNLKSLFMYKYDVLITDESLETLCKIGSLKAYQIPMVV